LIVDIALQHHYAENCQTAMQDSSDFPPLPVQLVAGRRRKQPQQLNDGISTLHEGSLGHKFHFSPLSSAARLLFLA
jgi:hypothetical protein